MKYRKLLEQYQKNLLDEGKKKQIEEDIEKHEAISEYLYTKEEEIPELQELLEETEVSQEKGSESFAELVNRSIRRAFLKMGTAVLVSCSGAAGAVCAAACHFVFLLRSGKRYRRRSKSDES